MAPPLSIAAKAALLVVDVQEDFCEPHGSLALKGGRELATPINQLLDFSGFKLKLAARDFHPPGHFSFASRHEGAVPFTSEATMINPENPGEQITTKLYPDHCVQGTTGCEIISEINTKKLHASIPKGTHPDYESYSAFGPPFKNPRVLQTELHDLLQKNGVTHLFCVGLSYNVCVFYTAVDGAEMGYRTYVIEDATASRLSLDDMLATRKALEERGVRVINMDSDELKVLRWWGTIG